MSSILNATTSSGLVTSADNSGLLQLATNNGTTAVTIDTSQNVGIGTSSPNNRLHVLGGTDTRSRVQESGGTFFDAVITNAGHFFDSTGTGDWTFNKIGSANMVFKTNNTERVRIDSSGNLLVGTTSSYGSGVGLCGFADGTAALRLKRGSDYGATARFYNFSTSEVGSITVNASSTAYVTSSDYRLKENIAPMTGALDVVQQLKPVTYNWKVDGSAGQGFIAHELQAVVPDCVTGEKDAVETYTDEEGNEQTRPVYQGVDTSFLVATLTAALQEAHGLIKDLQTRVETLEAK